MLTKMPAYKNNNSGFALLLTLVIVSIILAVGLTLLQITMKQLSLSAVARESEIAFYAASTGIECMQYWRSFPPTRAALLKEEWDGVAYDPDEPVYLQCADSSPVTYEEITSMIDDNVYGYKYSYNLSYNPLVTTDDTCVETSMYLIDLRAETSPVVEDISDLNEGLEEISCDEGTVCTTIFSRGYNRPCGYGLNTIFTVQRELTIEY